MSLSTRTVEIFENPEAWYVIEDRGDDRELLGRYGSGGEALAAVRDEDAVFVDEVGDSRATTIHWHPRTWLGQMVVEALQEDAR